MVLKIEEIMQQTCEGAIFVYKELPKWFFVAQLETLEVDDWGIKATVLPLLSVGLSCPPQAFAVSGAWDILSLTEMRWSAFYAGCARACGSGPWLRSLSATLSTAKGLLK